MHQIFEFLTAMKMLIVVFVVVMPSGVGTYQQQHIWSSGYLHAED
jgi:hypothetical protein